jgi:hypothetical protein
MKAVLGSRLKEVPKKKMLDENIHSHLPEYLKGVRVMLEIIQTRFFCLRFLCQVVFTYVCD